MRTRWQFRGSSVYTRVCTHSSDVRARVPSGALGTPHSDRCVLRAISNSFVCARVSARRALASVEYRAMYAAAVGLTGELITREHDGIWLQ